jgi:hypothetical protein
MWRAAGVPFDDIVNGMLGRDLLERLQSSLLALRRDPERFRAMDPPNKWGSYDGLCDVVQSMIDAIEKYPNAVVTTWR